MGKQNNHRPADRLKNLSISCRQPGSFVPVDNQTIWFYLEHEANMIPIKIKGPVFLIIDFYR